MTKRVDSNGVETNEFGGKQSHLDTCYTCIPFNAIERVAKTLEYGRVKYNKDNWRLIPLEDHLEHALRHVFAYLGGETTNEDDLAHAATRLLFALELDKDKE